MNAKEKELYEILIENMKLMKKYEKLLDEIKTIYDCIDDKKDKKSNKREE